MGSAQIGEAEGKICADAEQSLERSQFPGYSGLLRNSDFERRKAFCRGNDRRNERLPCACWQLRLKLGAHAWAKNKHTEAAAATSKNGRCSTHVNETIEQTAPTPGRVYSRLSRAKTPSLKTNKRKLNCARGGNAGHVTAITPLRAGA